MQTQQYTGGVTVLATWQAREGEGDAVADLLARFAPMARAEPGVKLFLVHRSTSDLSQFMFYELFQDEAAFATHQQTDHFRSLIQGEGLPRLVKRERLQYAIL